MSDWMHEPIPDKIPPEEGNISHVPFLITGNYMELQCGPQELLGVLVDYYGYRLRDFERECSKAPWNKWDDRHKMSAVSVSVYVCLLQKLSNTDYDYIEDMANDISEFYTELLNAYNIAKERRAEESKMVFLIGIRLMQDIMDHIYCMIGLPIE